jgi:5-methylcytosine-specific restriction protein A
MPIAPKTLRTRRAKQVERRPNSHQRGYTPAWERASAAWLKQQFSMGNVRCAMCGKVMDRERKDIVVDHIIDHKGNDDLFWNENNWQMLCRKPCHSRKTARENRFGQG